MKRKQKDGETSKMKENDKVLQRTTVHVVSLIASNNINEQSVCMIEQMCIFYLPYN